MEEIGHNVVNMVPPKTKYFPQTFPVVAKEPSGST